MNSDNDSRIFPNRDSSIYSSNTSYVDSNIDSSIISNEDSRNDSSIDLTSPKDFIEIKIPTNRTNPDCRAELAMKSK